MDPQAGDRVHDQPHAARAGDLGDRLDVVDRAGRGLAVGREDRLDAAVLREPPLDLQRIDRMTPFHVDRFVRNSVSLHQIEPALAELAAHHHQRPVAGLEQVDDRRLHRARARGREHEHLALRAMEIAKRVGHPPEGGAEHLGPVVWRHGRERAQDASRDLDRARRIEAHSGRGLGRALRRRGGLRLGLGRHGHRNLTKG